MAVTQEQSAELAAYAAGNFNDLQRVDKKVVFFTFTQGAAAGDAGSLSELQKLPAGRCTILLNECFVNFSAMGSSRTMDLGWLAYTDPNGTAVAADPNGLDDGVDVSSAGVLYPPTGTITAQVKEFDSREGVTITAQTNDGTIPAAATITGYLTYTHTN